MRGTYAVLSPIVSTPSHCLLRHQFRSSSPGKMLAVDISTGKLLRCIPAHKHTCTRHTLLLLLAATHVPHYNIASWCPSVMPKHQSEPGSHRLVGHYASGYLTLSSLEVTTTRSSRTKTLRMDSLYLRSLGSRHVWQPDNTDTTGRDWLHSVLPSRQVARTRRERIKRQQH